MYRLAFSIFALWMCCSSALQAAEDAWFITEQTNSVEFTSDQVSFATKMKGETGWTHGKGPFTVLFTCVRPTTADTPVGLLEIRAWLPLSQEFAAISGADITNIFQFGSPSLSVPSKHRMVHIANTDTKSIFGTKSVFELPDNDEQVLASQMMTVLNDVLSEASNQIVLLAMKHRGNTDLFSDVEAEASLGVAIPTSGASLAARWLRENCGTVLAPLLR